MNRSLLQALMRPGLVLCATFIAAAAARSQPAGTPVEIARSFQLRSRVLGETRVIDVTLPRGYASSADRYPLVVVLDGEFEHEIAAAIARFYASASQLPPTIVVGVRNTNRMRDMTPPPVPGLTVPREAGSAGGAENFLRFLANELTPYLDSVYRTAPMRVIVGHSLGGLFALYALAKQPALFTGYVVMEPSVWWNEGREFAAAREALSRPEARRVRLMMVNTQPLGVDTTRCGGDGPMVRHLRTSDETHASMAAAGLLAALRTMFADFKPTPWRPGTRPIVMLERYDSLAARVGYDVPIPPFAFGRVARMSIHGRFFEDAERVLDRMERSLGQSAESRDLRALLAAERATPVPAGFIPLVIPERRPTPRDAAPFLGRWASIGEGRHEVEVRASGDTIIVHDRVQLPGGEWDEGDHPVIQVTADGTLEWGLPWFRNIPALLVLRGGIMPDGTMRVTREARGWVPEGRGPDLTRVIVFRRVP
jgi:predicted alpha/beta superfamily hydrolase